MRPVDPGAGPVQQFAADLRSLRELAGNPPFRELARRAHYSPSTLSVACSGTALPSLEVTLAFVRACGGPAGEWAARWQALAPGEAVAKGGSTAAGSRPAARPAAPAGTASPAARRRWRPGRAASAAIGVLAGGAVVAAALTGYRATGGGAVAGSAAAVMAGAQAATGAGAGPSGAGADGPQQRGTLPHGTGPADAGLPATAPGLHISPCDPGSVTVRRVVMRLPVRLRVGRRRFPAGAVLGWVSLRYSPRCVLAWPRFIPATPFSSGVPGTLTLRAERVQDGATSTLHVDRIIGLDGDPLLVAAGCVLARAEISFGPGRAVVTGTTPCFQ